MGPTRRLCLAVLLLSVFATGALAPTSPALAKDGGSDGGGSSGDGGSSGHGGGDDSGGDDHGGHGNDDNGKDDGGKSAAGNSDSDRARDAVRSGQIMPLKSMLKKIDSARLGRVIDIRLTRLPARDIYQLKLRDVRGAIHIVRVDARTGAVIGSE
jgi:uncharacterized membrane protein YkoI